MSTVSVSKCESHHVATRLLHVHFVIFSLDLQAENLILHTCYMGPSYVAHVFNLLQIITNGRYKSAVHRAVVNAERARLSVATFYDPSKSQKICTAPQLVSKDHPQKYRDVIYGDYVSSWYSKGPEGKRNIDALLIEQ